VEEEDDRGRQDIDLSGVYVTMSLGKEVRKIWETQRAREEGVSGVCCDSVMSDVRVL